MSRKNINVHLYQANAYYSSHGMDNKEFAIARLRTMPKHAFCVRFTPRVPKTKKKHKIWETLGSFWRVDILYKIGILNH